MLELSRKFKEKRVFVTGAAMGLGKAFCTHFAKDGWTIGMSDISMERLEQTAVEIKALGGTPILFKLDVANREEYRTVAQNFVEQTGGIDVLVNNAGVGDGASFHEYSLENWDWMIGINQMGVIHGCHFFVPTFMKQKSGHIINIASAAGYANPPRMSPYNVTKAAVISLSESLNYELSPLGIQTSVVMPTFIKTEIMSNARGSSDAIRAGRKLLDKTKLLPEDAVLEMLTKAGKGHFEIVLPKDSRMGYWLKRHFPGIFKARLMKLATAQIERANQRK